MPGLLRNSSPNPGIFQRLNTLTRIDIQNDWGEVNLRFPRVLWPSTRSTSWNMCIGLSVYALGRLSSLWIELYHSSQTRAHEELPAYWLVCAMKLSSSRVRDTGYKLRSCKLLT